MTKVTRILNQIKNGDPSASEQLLPLVYEELRILARQRLANEKPGQTLQATALVHEAYLRLVGIEQDEHWDGRGHFFAAAAEAMRRILVDNARRKNSKKRGGAAQQRQVTESDLIDSNHQLDVLELDDALRKLEDEDPQAAELVKLRYFAGLTADQAAKSMSISTRTAERIWVFARAFLFRDLQS